ncbi:hypothetical protein HanIR_Chr15g0749921 [Helianthus annuus]|nr:hypothetical protein HanIR_Chr15g0749921 [Helianthus annuus]
MATTSFSYQLLPDLVVQETKAHTCVCQGERSKVLRERKEEQVRLLVIFGGSSCWWILNLYHWLWYGCEFGQHVYISVDVGGLFINHTNDHRRRWV